MIQINWEQAPAATDPQRWLDVESGQEWRIASERTYCRYATLFAAALWANNCIARGERNAGYARRRAGFPLGEDTVDGDDIVLADERGELARFVVREALRPSARAVIDALHDAGATVEILSGDSATRTAAAASRLGADCWHARQTPAQKLDRIAQLQQSGHAVAVVGDGVNDAPALAAADLAIALGGGAELAHSTADIVLAGDRLESLVQARRIAAKTPRVMRQNLVWAIFYNAASVPLAALGFVPP